MLVIMLFFSNFEIVYRTKPDICEDSTELLNTANGALNCSISTQKNTICSDPLGPDHCPVRFLKSLGICSYAYYVHKA